MLTATGCAIAGFAWAKQPATEFATPRTVAEDGKQSVHRLGDTRRATQSIRREGAPTAFRDRTQRPEKKTVATATSRIGRGLVGVHSAEPERQAGSNQLV